MSAENVESAIKWGFILVIVLLLSKYLQQLASSLRVTVTDIFSGGTGDVVGPAKFITDNNPLTQQEAVSIANQLGAGNGFTLSPDHFQIWFFNGSFYDKRTKRVTAADGSDAGLAFDTNGSPELQAMDAVNAQTQPADSVDTTDLGILGTLGSELGNIA